MTRNLFAFLLMSMSVTTFAGTQSAIQSCYSDKLNAPKGAKVGTELFIIIDQTTVFDSELKQSIANNIKPFLLPGNALSVTKFSAFTKGHYTDVVVNVVLDAQLSQAERNDVSKPVLAKFDQCTKSQLKLAGKAIGGGLKAAFGDSTKTIDKSDVLTSLKDISARVKKSTADRKIVLLASDMLENSSLSSFYSKHAVRLIEPKKELEIFTKNGAIGDFGGADVFVIGAGLLSEEVQSAKVYRSPQVMGSLKNFWEEWFDRSKANLRDFGAPALLSPVN